MSWGRPAAAALVAVLGLSACGSTRSTAQRPPAPTTTAASTTPVSTTTSASTTVAGLTPTAYNCGGGSYEPATLIVVCGVGSTTVTDCKWASWSASGAEGSGVVHPSGLAPSGANLTLSKIVSTPNGPQFSQLTVDWTGPSPDGQPSATFALPVAH